MRRNSIVSGTLAFLVSFTWGLLPVSLPIRLSGVVVIVLVLLGMMRTLDKWNVRNRIDNLLDCALYVVSCAEAAFVADNLPYCRMYIEQAQKLLIAVMETAIDWKVDPNGQQAHIIINLVDRIEKLTPVFKDF